MKDNNPLISVVIVAGPNRLIELIRCIQSVYASTYKDFEILIIDNSCSNRLYEKAKTTFPSLRILQMPANTGIFAYNVGFANAKGKYILALDDDSAIYPDTLKKIYDVFAKKPKTVGILSFNQYNPLWEYYYYSHYVQLKMVDVYTFVGGACAFRKDIFAKIGYYDTDFFCWVHEDDFAARALNAGYQIHFEKDIVINHYEKESEQINKKKIFLIFRNKVWFPVKHFSVFLLPVFVVKEALWFFSMSSIANRRSSLTSLKRRTSTSLLFAILGTLYGIFTIIFPLRKRQVMRFDLQKKYINYYFTILKYIIRLAR
ncbi:MAG: glycosyltransferase [bacterium]|nr:glycosyltransferase [bacterium]